MEKICIIIRVYDRIEDLESCLAIIRRTWKAFDYHVVVVSNGKVNGFNITSRITDSADVVVELENNDGHLKGNAQLLLSGIPCIPEDCAYTIILEADTWIYGDKLVKKYVAILKKENAIWASAKWYSHLYSLATDFAIIESSFLKTNKKIIQYTGYPECYAANYILDLGSKFVYIKENMPVHLPSYLKRYPFTIGTRFNVFPKSKMITHHLEFLKGGIVEKKLLFNTIAGHLFFEGTGLAPNCYLYIKMRVAIKLSRLFPIKGMFLRTKKLPIQ